MADAYPLNFKLTYYRGILLAVGAQPRGREVRHRIEGK